jgi:hypothetical protein
LAIPDLVKGFQNQSHYNELLNASDGGRQAAEQ